MDKPIPEAVVTDKLIAALLPRGLIFAETAEHLDHARQRAKTILLKALAAARQPDHIVDATKMVAQQQGQAVALDRMAIRLLVAAGFVTEDKANEALRIAHGFDKGPLAPHPTQQGGGDACPYRSTCPCTDQCAFGEGVSLAFTTGHGATWTATAAHRKMPATRAVASWKHYSPAACSKRRSRSSWPRAKNRHNSSILKLYRSPAATCGRKTSPSSSRIPVCSSHWSWQMNP